MCETANKNSGLKRKCPINQNVVMLLQMKQRKDLQTSIVKDLKQ